jgi:superfamily I DNA and/or RNA helicase
MENKDKLISLFKYIKELYTLKYQIVTDVKRQEWNCNIEDIPADEENIVLRYADRVELEEEQAEENILLMVTKPEFEACYQLPVTLIDWVEPGWNKFTNTAQKIDYKEEINEKFEDSSVRVRDWSEWNEKRNLWVNKQKKIQDTRNFFNQLYMNYISLERDSETIELMVGEGIIVENEAKSVVNHPVLLKRLKMKFDSENNVISIIDTNVESELYTMLLQELDYINHSAIKALKELLAQNYFHPMDRNETPVFLKNFIQMLCSESKFVTGAADEITSYDKLLLYIKPVFFIRKRISGVVKAIEEIIAQIETDGVLSGPLLNLIGDNKLEIKDTADIADFSDKLAALSGEDKEVLLSKEANREQLEIAKRIERYNAVLVQGPPGTGKTHTIANLMGHFLAQGKSILVTSHTKKALTVVKDKIPKGLQNLCVSILEDTNRDMERSVDGITETISAHSSVELFEKAERFKAERNKLLDELAAVRKKIQIIKEKECAPIIFDGKGYSPSEAAAFVNENSETLSYIPGKVELYKPLPVTLGDLDFLYKTNREIDPSEEIELGHQLPNPDSIIMPSDFKKCVSELHQNLEKLEIIRRKIGSKIEIDVEEKQIYINHTPLVNTLNIDGLKDIQIYMDSIEILDDWLIYAVLDGIKGGGYKSVWEQLLYQIQDTADYAELTVNAILGKQIIIDDGLNMETLNAVLTELGIRFGKGKKVSKLDLLLHKTWAEVMQRTRVNGNFVSTQEECDVLLKFAKLQDKRRSLGFLWDELVAKHGGTNYAEFGTEPERICLKRAGKIEKYLNWHDNTFQQLLKSLENAGINKQAVFPNNEYNSEVDEIRGEIYAFTERLPLYIEALQIIYIEIIRIKELIKKSETALSGLESRGSVVCMNIAASLRSEDTDAYEENYNIFVDLYTKYYYLNERIRILQLLRQNAPDWAAQIKNRIGIHGQDKTPEDIEKAWKWKQLAGIIEDITSEPFDKLQHMSVSLNTELRHMTTKLAEYLAWYHLLKRIEKDIDKKQALQGWKLTVKKIGKGTGKNAPKFLREAQKLMAKCQTAVPAWIMPVNKALESLDPTSNKFDIVIIDEASQSDISALAIMYLANKIIIVGDDEQVSPSAIGIDTDKIDALAAMFIKGVIPNYHLYDMKTSLYDIAKTTFPVLMLREHFRCVPDIIGYSNKLSYDFKIKPLRDASNIILKPATISFRVDGVRLTYQKVNIVEAENIVALMMACMEQPEYNSMTFGAISLLGDEQAKKINELALEKIEPKTYEKHSILCGNASHFQGDERDVIFLSLVDHNEGEGPLKMVGEGAGKATKQRYNVAASRAKNQLWVVHSLDISRDLKSGDMRRDLIEYVNNPHSFAQRVEALETLAESPFEKAVSRNLVSLGYHIVQQWGVGSYRIDMVAISGDKKVAIECDGEAYHSGEEKVREDMERQTVLERLGWRFIRIRGSEYYRFPQKTMDRVITELESLNIFPESINEENEDVVIKESALLTRVKIRAAQILDVWKTEGNLEIDDKSFTLKTMAVIKSGKDVKRNLNVQAMQENDLVLEKQDIPLKVSNVIKPIGEKRLVIENLPEHNDVTTKILQGNISDDELIAKLNESGLEVIDNRKQSDIIWVIYLEDFKDKIESLVEPDYRAILEKRGARATDGKAAWRIMKR